ncbi:MAG: hypothetical protein ACK5JD_07050 [Mangrovibacterium sp.]
MIHFNLIKQERLWRLTKTWGLILVLGVSSFGCETDETDEYYVKYRVESANINPGGEINLSLKQKNGTYFSHTINQNTAWEMVIGPVAKGFTAELSATNKTGTTALKMYTEIHVSKNDRPFVIQDIDGIWDNNSTIISSESNYTIDY